ncbi:MAG: radical SAM protein [Candidatus Gracilibacteria bacterium]|nr:radical SAM protein [Candidatus Gracilibacteria bacterium]
MITKIFYSLVLFPNINYQDKLNSGFLLVNIFEKNLGIFECLFLKHSKKESIIFTHIDFISNKNEFTSKNWQLSGENKELLQEIFNILKYIDKFDFNFLKGKSFYYNIPFGVVLNITSKCNLFCDYCFNDYDYPLDTRNSRKTLGLEDFIKIIDELYEAGTRDIILTGGEPFSCNFLWELLDYLKEKNIFIRINTNGTLLYNSTLERLNNNYSLHLMVSMHEFNNKDYYELNKKGASNIYGIKELKKWESKYEDKVKQLKEIKNYQNLSLDFLTILTPKNIIYLDKIYNYILSNFNIKDWHFFRLFSTGTTKGISSEMINLAIHKIYKLNNIYKTNFKIVDAVPFCVTKDIDIASHVIEGELSFNHNIKTIITSEGNIQIMSAFDMHLGNIFEKGIKNIWESEFVQKKLTNGFLPKDCYDCKYKDECMGGSRMNANIYNGAYDALDPLCNLENKKR